MTDTSGATRGDQHVFARVAAGVQIREAITRFNEQGLSLSSVETLRRELLAIAEFLAPSTLTTMRSDENAASAALGRADQHDLAREMKW